MSINTIAWILPRPPLSCYPGGVPLHFEKKLLRHLGISERARILQPFGGMGIYGLRCDLNIKHPLTQKFGEKVKWRPPDIIADAHYLPFSDNTFDLVFCDPPYSTEESQKLYGTPKVIYKRYIAEAVRVCREGGYIASYHVVMTPRPPQTIYHSRILLGTRIWHKLRACCIFKKTSNSEESKKGDKG